jgi:hypothetical protein
VLSLVTVFTAAAALAAIAAAASLLRGDGRTALRRPADPAPAGTG